MKYKLVKVIIFITLLIIIITKLDKFLTTPFGTYWANQTGMTEAAMHKDAYDVCFLGTSMVIANICNQELYEKYGVAGISIGEPDQPICLSRYTLEDFLEHQSPQVVFFDTKALFYGDEWKKNLKVERKDYIVHTSISVIKSPIIKRKALQDVEQYLEMRDERWSYYSNLYYSHENWKKITERNINGYKMSDCINGNVAMFGTYELGQNMYDTSSMDMERMIDEKAERYFADMVNLCQKANTTLVLITGYTSFDKSAHKEAMELAQKYNVEYIDINEHIEDVGLEHRTDTHDGIHFNLTGAIKWTDYLGKYLTQNYDFPDRRNDKAYGWYKKQSEILKKQQEMMTVKQNLLASVTFDEYLDRLKELKKDENAVFISVYDEASYSLTETEKTLFYDLGLSYDLTGKYLYSYVAAIYGNIVKEDISADETIKLEGNIGDNVDYKVVSGGHAAGVSHASILINGEECMQKGRGFNIVVYNTELNQVVSSVYFDTHASANPFKGRYTTKTINEHEIALNEWETER